MKGGIPCPPALEENDMPRLTLIPLVCAALLTALPVAANEQLSRSLGVAPGTLSTAELIQLRQAREDDDNARVRVILDGRTATFAAQTASPGAVQLARSLGLQPGEYTVAEMQQIGQALQDGDGQRVRFVLNRDGDRPLSNRSPGHLTLARALGVDPGDYSTAQLADMYIDAHD
jgi:hypothetical protein